MTAGRGFAVVAKLGALKLRASFCHLRSEVGCPVWHRSMAHHTVYGNLMETPPRISSAQGSPTWSKNFRKVSVSLAQLEKNLNFHIFHNFMAHVVVDTLP